MATISISLGSFSKTSSNGVTEYGQTVHFNIPANNGINWATVTFTTNGGSTSNTADRAFLFNGTLSPNGWPLTGDSVNVSALQSGDNTFRVKVRSKSGVSCSWDISNITLNIDYVEHGGSGGSGTSYIGTFAVDQDVLDAGTRIRLVLGVADSDVYRDVSVWYGSGFNLQKATVGLGYDGSYREILFEIPISWCADIAPNTNSFQLMFYVTGYRSGGSAQGTASKVVTINVPSAYKPTIGNFVKARLSNGVPAVITDYIQNYSGVQLQITDATGVLGSTIVNYRITGAGFTANTATAVFSPLKTAGTLIFTAEVTDSRGRTATRTVSISVTEYSGPSGTRLSAYRSNASGEADDEGRYVTLRGARVYQTLGGKNNATIKGCVFVKGGTASSLTNMTDDTNLVFGGAFSIEQSYTAHIVIDDDISSPVTYVFDIPTAKVGLHILPAVAGAGIGMYGVSGYLDIAWPARSQGVDLLTANSGRYTGHNFFDNSDFSFPVNQRGVSGTVGATGYFYDRWILRGGSVTINPGYLTIGPNATIEQQIESGYLAGRSVVLSLLKSDLSVVEITGSFPGTLGATNTSAYPGGGVVDFYRAASGYVGIRIRPSAAVNVIRVKVEIGTKSTILHDVPEPYDVKLLRCQRYYVKYLTFPQFSYYAYGTTLVGQIVLPTAMRIVPTVLQPNVQIYHNGTIYNGTISGVSIRHNILRLNGALATSMPTTAGTGFFNDTLELSAEL